MDIRQGTILDGPNGETITVGKQLGQGGFGQVFAGVTSNGTAVAVKTMLTGALASGELETLLNEGRYAVGIVHPNVVHVLHFSDGTDGAGHPPYLVMELVEGQTLEDLLEDRRAQNREFTEDELRGIYLEIANGMEAVNQRIVHRDLKPSNVLIEKATGTLKIADFGLAKLSSAATRTETFKGWGTDHYKAPEAWEFEENRIAMDIYSAGVMFFELATFQLPVEPRPGDPPALKWRNAHLLVPPKTAGSLRKSLSEDLRQLLAKMLQKDPRKRPADWAEVRRTIERAQIQTGVDVSTLVRRATERVEDEQARATLARARQEQATERRLLLEQACEEPISMLVDLVEKLNEVSDLTKLEVTRPYPGTVKVQRGSNGGPTHSLSVNFQQIDDLELRTIGFCRIIGRVHVYPEPVAATRQDFFRNDSFGGFNLFYVVRSSTDRFGDWQQVRFEHGAFSQQASYPHWWAHSLDELPLELTLLNGGHIYQNQRCPLSHDWFRELLAHIV